ncbi:MAG: branched-chain amino acid transport system permease protein [Actinomycetota bacterium]|jgi:branched-chain amino acid transport system permease protein|nr:branched-chain amino acid transport system permease protein [Actinomycetota bacterium]
MSVLALSRRGPLANTLVRHLLFAVLGGLALLALTSSVSAYRDFQIANVGYYVVAVAGLTVLTGLNGQISLGHGALMMVGAYTAALLLERDNPLPLVVVLLLSVVVTAAVGAVVGAAAARLRGPYLAGATLAFAVGLPGLTSHYSGTFGGDNGLNVLTGPPPESLGLDFPTERWQSWITLTAALITLVLLANLASSRVGRSFRAVRDDEVSAELAGIHVARTQVLAFIISAACAGLAGGLTGVVSGQVSPGAFSVALSLSILAGAVLGGLGSLTGAVYGAVALVLMPSLASSASDRFTLSTDVQHNLPLLVYGTLLIVVMLAAPQGLQGGVRRLFALLRGRTQVAPVRNESVTEVSVTDPER